MRRLTIDSMLEAAYRSAGIFFNFTDLIVADPYKDMSKGLTLAYYIGQSHVVAGTTTDMLAYIDNGVFIQLWVGAEDKLPRMVRAMFLDDPDRLRGEVEFSNWQLDSYRLPGYLRVREHGHRETHSVRSPPGGAPAEQYGSGRASV